MLFVVMFSLFYLFKQYRNSDLVLVLASLVYSFFCFYIGFSIIEIR